MIKNVKTQTILSEKEKSIITNIQGNWSSELILNITLTGNLFIQLLFAKCLLNKYFFNRIVSLILKVFR